MIINYLIQLLLREKHLQIGNLKKIMQQIIEITKAEKEFFYRVYAVKTKMDITVPDAMGVLHKIYANTTSHGKDGCNYLFKTTEGIEVSVNAQYFGVNKNLQFFKYLMETSGEIWVCQTCRFEDLERKFKKEPVISVDPFSKCPLKIGKSTGWIYKCPHCDNVVHAILNRS